MSAELAWARLSASSSSCGAPEREPAVSVDACSSHFGESLTELASSYSLDGLVSYLEALGWGVNFDISCSKMFINSSSPLLASFELISLCLGGFFKLFLRLLRFRIAVKQNLVAIQL